MAGRKGGGVIGFDPLAWMKEPGAESAVAPPAPRASEAGSGIAGQAATAPGLAGTAPMPDRRSQTAAADPIGTARLGEILTIEQAAAMHAELGRHLGAPSVELDAAALQRIDAAGLQLLAAFVRAADARGGRIVWREPPAVLREGARRLGLSGALHLD